MAETYELALAIDGFARDTFLQYYDLDKTKRFISLKKITRIVLAVHDNKITWKIYHIE